jgi:hypothetical protein
LRLKEKVDPLEKQVKDFSDRVKDFQDAALHESMLKRERCLMYHDLATRTGHAVSRLGVAEYRPPSNLDDTDPTTFLHIFQQITELLESTEEGLESIVEKECDDLLGAAGSVIFSNLLRLNPAFNLGAVLETLDAPLNEALPEGPGARGCPPRGLPSG